MSTHDPALRPGRVASVLLTLAFGLVLLASVLALVPSDYVILRPGPVTNILGDGSEGKPIVTVSGHARYAAGGELNFTTVRQVGEPDDRARLLDVIVAALRPSEDVYDLDLLYPPGTTSQGAREESAAEMLDSQQVATAVALRSVGAKVTDHLIVGAVPDGSPATGRLEGGDRILAIDGTPVTTSEQVRTAVRRHRPGEDVTVTVRRGSAERTVRTTTRDSDGNAAIGIILGRTYDFPFEVKIDVGKVGGPSAGLMLALGINDLLTPGDLTGGQDVAGTGTLADDGTVGPIGGIAQKLVGARAGGARWFLAPADNCDEVRGRVPDGLRVVRVGTFAEAYADVRRIAAGDAAGLPGC